MKAIISKFHCGTLTHAARYSATDGDGSRVFSEARDDLNSDENHREAVRKLCAKMGWTGTLVVGDLIKQGAKVWVWRQERRLVADELVILTPCLPVNTKGAA